MQPFDFSQKSVLVTGGTSGIGKATATAFASLGAHVIITGRHQDTLDQTAQEIDGQVSTLQLDQADFAAVQNLASQVQEITETLDVAFLNAGHGDFAPVGSIDENHFDTQFDVLVKGTLFSAQQVLSLMFEGGAIIFNVSVVATMSMSGASVYSAAKAAVRRAAQIMAKEQAQAGIRVNMVSPGPIQTDFFNKTSMNEEQINGFAAGVQGQVPMGRFGQPEEIASAVVFLASEQASYVTGVDLPVDGGISL